MVDLFAQAPSFSGDGGMIWMVLASGSAGVLITQLFQRRRIRATTANTQVGTSLDLVRAMQRMLSAAEGRITELETANLATEKRIGALEDWIRAQGYDPQIINGGTR